MAKENEHDTLCPVIDGEPDCQCALIERVRIDEQAFAEDALIFVARRAYSWGRWDAGSAIESAMRDVCADPECAACVILYTSRDLARGGRCADHT